MSNRRSPATIQGAPGGAQQGFATVCRSGVWGLPRTRGSRARVPATPLRYLPCRAPGRFQLQAAWLLSHLRCLGNMAESAESLVDEVYPEQPVHQPVLSVPFLLRFLFASHPDVMGHVLGIVHRCIAAFLIKRSSLAVMRPFRSHYNQATRPGRSARLELTASTAILGLLPRRSRLLAGRSRGMDIDTNAELASVAGLSLSRFCDSFSRRVGKSPRAYLRA